MYIVLEHGHDCICLLVGFTYAVSVSRRVLEGPPIFDGVFKLGFVDGGLLGLVLRRRRETHQVFDSVIFNCLEADKLFGLL